jgi:hypothetical protein
MLQTDTSFLLSLLLSSFQHVLYILYNKSLAIRPSPKCILSDFEIQYILPKTNITREELLLHL